MDKNAPKKLTLSRETLHALDQLRLGLVAGGASREDPRKGTSTLECTQ